MPPAAEDIIEPGGEGDYADVEVGSDILYGRNGRKGERFHRMIPLSQLNSPDLTAHLEE